MSPPGRPPEPSASSASPPAREIDVSARAMLMLGLAASTHPSTSPRLLLEVPLRRFSVQSVHSRLMPKHPPSAPSCHRGSLVPSSWFLSTSTSSSGLTARALLQPAADPGVHRVSRRQPPAPALPRERSVSVVGSFPTMHSPREDSLHQQRLPSLTAPSEDAAFTRGCSLHDVAREATAAVPSALRHPAYQRRLSPLALDFEVSFR